MFWFLACVAVEGWFVTAEGCSRVGVGWLEFAGVRGDGWPCRDWVTPVLGSCVCGLSAAVWLE